MRIGARTAANIAAGLLALGVVGCGGDDGAAELGDESETAGESGDTQSEGSEDPSGDGDGDGDGDNTSDPDSGETGDPGPQGVFVAVGDGGRRASSNDALTWAEIVGSGVVDTQAEEGEEDILRAVAVGDGVVIAVGGGGSDWNGNAMIMRSVDGETWDEDLVAGLDGLDDRKLDAVGFADGVFIAAGHQSHVLRSDDGGLSWTRVYGEHHSDTTVFGVAGHAGTFVLVGSHKDSYDAPKVAYVQRSTDDGLSFGAPVYSGDDGDFLNSVATNGEVFVAVGPNQCLRSGDGSSWESCGVGGSSYGAVSFTRDRFVVTYLDGVSTSDDGQSWSAHVESPTGVPAEIVFGNGVYAGLRYYDRGTSEVLGEWAYVNHGGFPLRDLAFLPVE
ncbi:Alkaline phosphatase [Enhygromyxa salina]|uniref:Alkaline phosphatase n=1 Tax=Enhygromyxa salina TaxID=215803 RepID=A0A0C2DDG5_9BACT|nr:Alkaline phosphatase [Enhygromyxa salina]